MNFEYRRKKEEILFCACVRR